MSRIEFDPGESEGEEVGEEEVGEDYPSTPSSASSLELTLDPFGSHDPGVTTATQALEEAGIEIRTEEIEEPITEEIAKKISSPSSLLIQLGHKKGMFVMFILAIIIVITLALTVFTYAIGFIVAWIMYSIFEPGSSIGDKFGHAKFSWMYVLMYTIRKKQIRPQAV